MSESAKSELKKPRLFYFEEGEDCWCPADGMRVDAIVDLDSMVFGEEIEVRFKRFDMTDAELAAIPEI